METPIKVSVIIPVYNTELYLREAIDSIVNQTLKEIEIIIVNDGSTDNSGQIIAEYAKRDSRIKVITQENQGQAIARNEALKIAYGEYIYFMDSDDILDVEALAICSEKCDAENLDFVIFNAKSFGEENIPVWFDYQITQYIPDKVQQGADILNNLLDLRRYRCSVCLLLIKKEYIEKYDFKFHPKIIHEDELFGTQLYLFARRVSKIDKTFFNRRLRPNSTMSNSFSMKNVEGYKVVLKEIMAFKNNESLSTQLINKYITYILNIVLCNAWNLNFKDRYNLVIWAIANYRNNLFVKSIAILLFKKLFR